MKLIRAALAALALALALSPALADPAFRPYPNATVLLSATTTSSRATLAIPNGGGKVQLRFYNAGSVAVFVKFGNCTSTVADLTTSLPIAPGAVEVLSYEVNDTNACMSGITSTSTASLYLTTGYGS